MKSWGLNLRGANLGTLNVSTSTLSARGTPALNGDRLHVRGDADLDRVRTTGGSLRLRAANIEGELRLRKACLEGVGADGHSLFAELLHVAGDVLLHGPMRAAGGLCLPGARISGQLICHGAQLRLAEGTRAASASLTASPQQGNNDREGGFVADGAWVQGNVFLDAGFTSGGAVRLPGATVCGQLWLSGAKLGRDRRGVSLFANGMTAGNVMCNEDRGYSPRDDPSGVPGGGADDCFEHDDAHALRHERGHSLKPGLRFEAAGSLELKGVTLRGDLNCRAASLGVNNDGLCLVVTDAHVTASIDLTGSSAPGTIDFTRSRIDGQLNLDDMYLPGRDHAVVAVGLRVGEALRWTPRVKPAVEARVDLRRAHMQTLIDRSNAWPAGGRLSLDGLVYGAIGEETGEDREVRRARRLWSTYRRERNDARTRIKWLRKQVPEPKSRSGSAFFPQPYEQLAEVYRRHGRERDAREVAVAREDDLRRYGNLTGTQWMTNFIAGRVTRHGYAPLRAVGALLVIYLFCALAFQQHSSSFVRTRPLVSNPSSTAADGQTQLPGSASQSPAGTVGRRPERATPQEEECGAQYPCFHPWAYAFDTTVPLFKLGQTDFFRPDTSTTAGARLQVLGWTASAAGWVLATIVAVGVSGTVRKAR